MSESDLPKKDENGPSAPPDPHSQDWQSTALAPEVAGAGAPKPAAAPTEDPVAAFGLPPSSLTQEPPLKTEPRPWQTFSSEPATQAKDAATGQTDDVEELPPVEPANKIGLLGGKGVGKTYLFHGMVYRTLDQERAGAVSYYLHSSDLRIVEKPSGRTQRPRLHEIMRSYESWRPFLQTTLGNQIWYRLRLEFYTGLLGRKESQFQMEFLDGSGEGFTRPLGDLTTGIWKEAFRDAGIMVFCLPMWAAFPADDLNEEDRKQQNNFLNEFYLVLENYREIRNRSLKVRSILALTMADDDQRCSLRDVIDKWIKSYTDDHEAYLQQLRKGRGITQYLANAQAISDRMLKEFRALKNNPLVSRIPRQLDFGRGLPWIIPISAVEGKTLARAIEARKGMTDDAPLPPGIEPPVPIHVELPLLAALCENHNALM